MNRYRKDSECLYQMMKAYSKEFHEYLDLDQKIDYCYHAKTPERTAKGIRKLAKTMFEKANAFNEIANLMIDLADDIEDTQEVS